MMLYPFAEASVLKSPKIDLIFQSVSLYFWSWPERDSYTQYRNWSNAHFHFLLYSRFEWEPLERHKQMIPHFLALDVGLTISQAQLCSSIRDDYTTFLVKNTLFKEEVAWQLLKKLESCSPSILVPPSRAFIWGIVCLSTIIGCREINGNVKKCWFSLHKIDTFWHYP